MQACIHNWVMNGKVQKNLPAQMMSTRIDPELHRKIKELAAREGTSVQHLVVKALEDLLQKYGVPYPEDREG